jgi:hypothetical protein
VSRRLRLVSFLVALAAVVVAVGVGALVSWWPQPARYQTPPPEQTAVLDDRARRLITAWDGQHPQQPARRYMPVRPYLPDQPMGWTFRSGHDPRPGRDEHIERAIGGGRLKAAVPLPDARPVPATMRWEDGAAADIPLVSAAEAFAAVLAEPCRQTPCDQPQLRVTAADLGAVPAQTAHGWASVPAWLFTIEDTPVRIARIAIAPDTAPGKVHDSFHQPGVDYARVHHGLLPNATAATADSSPGSNPSATALIVEFPGAPPGNGPCEGEYTAHVIEGVSAVVVVVQPLQKPKRARDKERDVSCAPLSPFGPFRQQTVYLSRPLGERVLLDISDGLPRMVSKPRPQ